MSTPLTQKLVCEQITNNILPSNTVILTLESTLSPAGARLLKDERLRSSTWPNPLIYTLHEIAAKILIEHERFLQRPLYPQTTMNPAGFLAKFAQVDSNPLALLLNYKKINCLRSLGLSLPQWKELLNEYEATDDSPDWKNWTKRILFYLELKAYCQSTHLWESKWDKIEAAIAVLQDNEFSINWHNLLEVPPTATTFNICISDYQSPLPLEATFLSLLSKNMSQEFQSCLSENAIAEKSPMVIANRETITPANSAIFWCQQDGIPSTNEVINTLDLTCPIDTPPHKNESAASLKNLIKATQYCQTALKSPTKTLSLNILIAIICEELPNSDVFEEYQDINSFGKNLPQWLQAFEELGLLSTAIDKPWQTATANNGVPVLSFKDIGLCPRQQLIVVGDQQQLDDYLSPDGPLKSIYDQLPDFIQQKLLSMGLPLADTEHELTRIKKHIHSLGDRIRFLQPTDKQQVQFSELTIQDSTKIRQTLSASAIENFLQCPARYYFDRLQKFQSTKDPNPVRAPADLCGQLAHKALEEFFHAPDWNNIEKLLTESLEKNIKVVFETGFDEDFLQIMQAQSQVWVEKFAYYLNNWERPLQEQFPERQFHTEVPFKIQYEHNTFSGVIDRLDILPGKGLLLWDYKSSAVTGKIKTLVKNGKIQWLLYKEILDHCFSQFEIFDPSLKELNVIGGGYINLFNLSASNFLWDQDFVNHNVLISDLLVQKQIKSDSFSDFYQSDNFLTYKELLLSTIHNMKEGRYPAEPQNNNLCTTCSHTMSCGKVHFERSARR